ncbi:glycosyl hydrolase [Xylariaceae sp. FL0804]|nr:glycosyl hydrolase [Xylariaceae sp. FL0804]
MLFKETPTAVLPILALTRLAAATVDYTQYVNPFMGGSGPFGDLAFGGGDIFVGGALPFGVAKVGIDTYEKNITYSVINGGWTPAGLVTAVTMMHESGTGGEPKYGIIPQMPLTKIDAPVNVLDNTTYMQARVGNDSASVGYFKTSLESGVTIELSGARHSGIMQYTFPPAGEKHVLVDVSHYLPSEPGAYSSQIFVGGEISLNGSEYTGYGAYGGGFNEGAPFPVYFCGEFERAPDRARTFRGRNTDPMPRYHSFGGGPIPQAVLGEGRREASGPMNDRIGAVFTWGNSSSSTIRSRVGISMISAQKACQFKNDEIKSWDLNVTTAAAVKEWNEDVLSTIQVPTDDSANLTNVRLLYSSLYMTHLMPSNRTGENPLWDSGEPSFDDFYTLWDIFRCTTSLYQLIQPANFEGMVRSLIDIWKNEGYMPDGRAGNYNGLVQGGSNADNVLAEAFVKGVRGGINWTDGYAAMLKDAEVQPDNTFSHNDDTGSVKEGRGALYDWIPLGFVSADRSSRCLSRTVEYALNDYAVSVVAEGLGAPAADVQKYRERSAGWQRTWNPNVTSEGFAGFLTPRYANGSWAAEGYNPALCGECEWTAISYEATPWEYSFTVPHDMETLIGFMGGETEFERRLDYIFMPNTSQQDLSANGADITTIMNIGNEPDFATPYLYNYLNKQHKSVNQSRSLANQYFHDQLFGVPGNSDAGALNSWLIWQMLGLYPIATQPVFLLASPWFPDVNMSINGNATLRITSTATNTTSTTSTTTSTVASDGSGSLGQRGFYVQGVRINGREWDRNWFHYADVMIGGGTIEFTVGDNATAWETGEVPPSPGHVVLEDV